MSRCPTGGILPEKCGGGRQERTRCVPGWERLPGMVQWPDLIRAALPSRRHTARPGGAGRFAPAGVFCPTFRCGKNGLFCIGYTAGRKKAPRIHPRIAGEGCGTPFSFFCVFCGSVSSAPPPASRPGGGRGSAAGERRRGRSCGAGRAARQRAIPRHGSFRPRGISCPPSRALRSVPQIPIGVAHRPDCDQQQQDAADDADCDPDQPGAGEVPAIGVRVVRKGPDQQQHDVEQRDHADQVHQEELAHAQRRGALLPGYRGRRRGRAAAPAGRAVRERRRHLRLRAGGCRAVCSDAAAKVPAAPSCAAPVLSAAGAAFSEAGAPLPAAGAAFSEAGALLPAAGAAGETGAPQRPQKRASSGSSLPQFLQIILSTPNPINAAPPWESHPPGGAFFIFSLFYHSIRTVKKQSCGCEKAVKLPLFPAGCRL